MKTSDLRLKTFDFKLVSPPGSYGLKLFGVNY
jgi:hypothetical protein